MHHRLSVQPPAVEPAAFVIKNSFARKNKKPVLRLHHDPFKMGKFTSA
jgi:hypothetical protein